MSDLFRWSYERHFTSQEQYTFCHDAILEAVQCGNTQIYAHDLRITLARMDDASKDSKVTRFESEFKVSHLSPVFTSSDDINVWIFLIARSSWPSKCRWWELRKYFVVISVRSYDVFFFSFISQTLNKVSPVYIKASYSVATYPENKEKNRSPEILARKFLLTVMTNWRVVQPFARWSCV